MHIWTNPEQIKSCVFLFVFTQEQPSEPGWHGTRALYCCLQTSSSRPDLHRAADLRFHHTDMGHLPHAQRHRCHLPCCHPASFYLLKKCHLLRVQHFPHTVPQDTQGNYPGEILLINLWCPLWYQPVLFIPWSSLLTFLAWVPLCRPQGLLLCFVFLTVLITYLNVLWAARAASGLNQASARNARNTILLHGVQLLICMSSFVSPFINIMLVTTWPEKRTTVLFTSYLVTGILPRLLSPLIYGIRDKTFSSHIRMLFCSSCYRAEKRVNPMGPQRRSKKVSHWMTLKL